MTDGRVTIADATASAVVMMQCDEETGHGIED